MKKSQRVRIRQDEQQQQRQKVPDNLLERLVSSAGRGLAYGTTTLIVGSLLIAPGACVVKLITFLLSVIGYGAVWTWAQSFAFSSLSALGLVFLFTFLPIYKTARDK